MQVQGKVVPLQGEIFNMPPAQSVTIKWCACSLAHVLTLTAGQTADNRFCPVYFGLISTVHLSPHYSPVHSLCHVSAQVTATSAIAVGRTMLSRFLQC